MNITVKSLESLRATTCALMLVALGAQVHAQTADIASYPFAKYTTAAVRANMVFIMDDSGSMDEDSLPASSYAGYCFGFRGINRIFYDPTITYAPPVDANGTPYPNAVFTSAKRNGYATVSTTTDLSIAANLTTPQVRAATGPNVDSRYYYSTPKDPAQTPCVSGNTNLARWNVIRVLPIDQQVNYANWFSYYRTRMHTMKAAVGRAMAAVDGTRFRVGFSRINTHTINPGPGFLPVGDFDSATHRAAFYSALYGTQSTGWTPLRSALDKIGKYYAKKTLQGEAWPASVPDPVQYSCQRNYAMLTTDGGWNREDEPDGYSPRRLDGVSAIGNPDGGPTIPRPLRDDGRLVGTTWSTGGSGVSNSLADIAQYYYITDLRPGTPFSAGCIGSVAGQDVCADEVVPAGNDTAKHQHMTTFSLGFGVAGNLTYDPNYETATAGSFFQLRQGTIAWPDPQVGSASDSTPVTRVDDLWHAAVNGRGRYYSAGDPAELVRGLTDALDNIAAVSGVAAAAATSSLQPVGGDNFMFIGEYTTVKWEGNLRAHTIDPVSGALNTTPIWEAKDATSAQVSTASDTRQIFFRNPTSGLRTPFTAPELVAAGYAAHFTNVCAAGKLSQCTSLTPAQQVAANDTAAMVNWIRGQKAHEDVPTNALESRVFRARAGTHLGDVVNASPAYVKAPPFKYTDPGYAAFKSANAGRIGVVYLASNDGMLHALNAATGSELWAYVPTMVMNQMHKRADAGYATRHTYMVDGSPVVGDVFDGSQWRTILVGGLGAGGKGYYALDITDPTNMKVLWEVSDAQEPNLGLSFGNPIIVKDKAGQWIVAFSSGYNNTGAGADGNGRVFIRNAITGAAIRSIATFTAGSAAAGSVASPSNLGKLNSWVDAETDNTASRLYGGDMKGNVWRFDFDDNVPPAGREATLLATLKGPTGIAQPITTAPMLSTVGSSNVPILTVGTGRYLGLSDVGNQSVQSLYAIKEELTSGGLGDFRARSDVVAKTWSTADDNGKTVRQLSSEAVDWNTKKGWRADFTLSAGERVTTGMAQASGYIGLATNVPKPTACNPGGDSWLYIVGVQSGRALDSTLIPAMAAGVNMVALPSGVRFMHVNINGTVTLSATLSPEGGNLYFRRNSWRELISGR